MAKSLYRLPLKIYKDFRGGLNTDSAPDAIADNELVVADDVDLGVRGGVSRRKAYNRLNEVSYEAQVYQNIEYTKNDGTIQLLSLIGTNLVLINEADWTIDRTVCAMSRTNVPHFFWNDKLFFLDGTEYRIWDGTECRLVQLPTPESAPTMAKAKPETAPTLTFSGSGGFMNGQYFGVVTFVTENGETDPSPSGSGISDSDTTLTWSNIPIGPAGTTARKLYRRYGNGAWILITTINDNTTTTYVDTSWNPTGGSFPTGSISGVYNGWVTYVQSDGLESNPSPVATVTVSSVRAILWDNIPIGPEGTTARKLYRTESGGTIGKLVATIEDNTTTVYFDFNTDMALGTNELVTDNNLTPIKSCDVLMYHPKSGRVFAINWNSAEVHYSELARPEYFRARASVTPTNGDGPVIGLHLFGDAIVAQYANSAWVWRGQDPSVDALWQKLPIPGVFSAYSTLDTPGTMTWIGPGGIYSTAPGILSLAGIKLETNTNQVVNFAENKIRNIINNMGSRTAISAVFDSDNSAGYIAYPDGKSSTENTHILKLDWGLKAFTRYTNINARHLLRRRNGDILAASNGYIVKVNGTGSMDPGDTPIAAKIKSKPHDLGFPFHKKRMLRLYTEFKAPDTGDVIITFNIFVDSILVYTRDHVSTGASFVWGESIWGDAYWGGRDLVATRSKISASGHRVEVEIICDQTDVDSVIIYGYGVEFRPIRAKGERI